jgi:hypothetical protein
MIALCQDWSDDVQALLESLGMLGAAIVPLAALPERLGIPAHELAPILDEARAADLVVDWPDAPVGPALMMTTRAADHLGLEMVAPSRFNIGTMTGCRTVRWVLRGDARNERADEADEVPESVIFSEAGSLDEQVDRSAIDPAVAASRAEEALRKRGLELEVALLRWSPILILGIRQTWPIANLPDGTCGACHGRKLERIAFCAWCNRSGVDALLGPVPKRIARHAYRPGRLPGGKGVAPAPAKAPAPKRKRKKIRKARAKRK